MTGQAGGRDRTSAGRPYRQLLGRWRLAIRLAWRDARRHPGRAVLIAVMVALPVAAGSFLVTTLESNEPYAPADVEAELGPRLQAKIEGIGGPIEQFRQPDDTRWYWGPVGWSPYYEDDSVESAYVYLERDLERILPDGDELVRALRGEVRLDDGDGAAMSVAVQTDFTEPDVASRFPVLEGRLPAEGEVAVTEQHRDLGFDLGETVEVTLADGTTTTATISGIAPRYIDKISPVLLPRTGPLSPPATVTSADYEFPLWYVTGDAPVTWSDVQDINAAGAFVTSRDVLLHPPAAQLGGNAWSGYVDWQSLSVLVALVVVGLLEAVWLIGPAFAVGARRDTRSLALLAVNGAPAPALRDVTLARGLLTGVAGSVAGLGLGIAAAALLVRLVPERLPALRLPEASLAVVLVVGVLIAVASAWPPARQAARADVGAALSGRRPAAPASRWPTVVGAAAATGGVALAVVSGAQHRVVGLSAGIVVADLGLILACGGIVALIGRVAHRTPWAWRYALRDAARHRARTVPAIAAVLVAMAGATAALTYFDAETAAVGAPPYQPWATTGTVAATWGPGTGRVFPDDDSERLEAVFEDVLPDAGPLMAVPVAVGSPTDGTDGTDPRPRRSALTLGVEPIDRSSPADEGLYTASDAWAGPVVSDGTDRDLLRALGIPDAHLDDVGAALADGRLPLPPSYVTPDGTARISVTRWTGTNAPVSGRTTLPATAVDGLGDGVPNLPVLPASLLDEIDAETAVGAYVAENRTVPSDRQLALLRSRLEAEVVGFDIERNVDVRVEHGERPAPPGLITALSMPWSNDSRPVMSLAIVLAAAFLALTGTWSAVALSAVEARADLATLSAVGAAPSARRTVVAAQAGTIAVTGSVLGLVAGTGIGIGWTLLSAFQVEIPWLQVGALAVGVPTLAVAAAWVATRAHPAASRRRP